MIVTYDSNNSGGDWWLSDAQWKALEDAGWTVRWKSEENDYFGRQYPDGRWLGALATEATREALSVNVAVAEWEEITGEYANDDGCDCCGPPHYFYGDDRGW